MRKLIAASLALAFLGACSTKAPDDPGKASPPKTPKIVDSSGKDAKGTGVSFDARQLANEWESNFVTEVHFRKGASELTPSDKNKIRSLYQNAKKEDALKTARLITWADKEMPSEDKGKLPADQVKLAVRRNEALASFIGELEGETEIKRISMAERPEGLKEIFPNETVRIQESLDRAGIPTMGEDKKGLGKESRSIIIFSRE